jgi:pre-mRNA cleavage complex 2 protein Pcf11
MERFTSIWHEKTQQPVWMDAIKIGNKYYHANCYKEVYGTLEPALGGGSGSVSLGVGFKTGGIVSNRSTPESVLGKRKYQAAV